MKKLIVLAIVMLLIAPAAIARTATSNTIHLIINTPPTFTTQPSNAEGYVGDSASFTVAVTATNPIYQWQKGGIDISGATSATLSLTNIQSTDAGTYTCDVTTLNGAGVKGTSNSATLTVHTLPSVTIVSSPAATAGTVTVNPGVSGGVTYTATPSGGWDATPTYSFQWQKSANGTTGWTNISAGAPYAIGDVGGHTGNVLIVDPVSASEEAYYRCVVDDNSGH